VVLVHEGTYAYRTGALGTWCHRLVQGLSEHQFQMVTLVETATERLYRPPVGGPEVITVRLDGPPTAAGRGSGREPGQGPPLPPLPPWRRRRRRPAGEDQAAQQRHRLATHAAVLLCRAIVDQTPYATEMFRSALWQLAAIGADGSQPLHGVPLGAVLLDAWKAGFRPGDHDAGGSQLPRATVAGATEAARLLKMAVRPLAAVLDGTEPVEADLYHTVDSGLSTLVGLGAKWRDGIPYVLSEHQPYLRAPLLARTVDPAVRVLLMRFLHALTRLAYQEAAAVAPPSERMRGWALHHGADRTRVTVIPPGVDPQACPPLRGEPEEPVIAWVGPEHELDLVLAAFALIRDDVPDARLVIVGTDLPGGCPPGVTVTGQITGRRPVYEMAQVVAVSGNDPAMPYPLIEAMMCGRPTVCTESGGLAATVGIGASIVPGDDPTRLAAGCLALLRDSRLRRELANSARQRSRTLFSLGSMLDGYRRAYAAAVRSAARPHAARSASAAVPDGTPLLAPTT
jgi:polysaccharide biosynthesis protein PelF